MEIFDYLVVGGGVVGTSIARELGSCGKKVVLCEKDENLLSGASSGNTGHLATNFYYTRDRALLGKVPSWSVDTFEMISTM